MDGKRRRNGFTLIEMLVAIVIFALFIGSVYGMYHAAHQSFMRAEEQAELSQSGRVLLAQLSNELACAYQSSSATACTLYGEDSEDAEEGVQEDRLIFQTTAHPAHEEQPAGDICQVSYSIAGGEDEEPRGLYVEELFHPDLALDDAEPTRQLLSPLVVGFNCLYLPAGGESWETAWSEEQTTLPAAVRVELTLLSKRPHAKPVVLSATTNLTMATAPEGGEDDAEE